MARGEPTKTIAHARAGGETALTVHCLGFGCYHEAVKTFEELKFWNDMIFVEIPEPEIAAQVLLVSFKQRPRRFSQSGKRFVG
jgi:hypothetical protein